MYLITDFLPSSFLDNLLAQGWYRMRQHIFTLDCLTPDDKRSREVFWARIRLDGYQPNSRLRKLDRLCRKFRVLLSDAMITPEIERLYVAYAQQVDFDAGPSAASFLLDERGINYFPARMWQLFDEDRLIAVGYFDEGVESAAGILNFYDPAYRKHSLGLWLYLHNVRYAAAQGRKYFYPGYIVMDYPKFDYKLLAGTDQMELWSMEGHHWYPYCQSAHALQPHLQRP
jgi:arginine-tRNA-protein transferase